MSTSRRFVFVLAAFLVLSVMVVPSASAATVSRDGWGFGVADDDWDWEHPGSLPALGTNFEKLRPKTFRFQIIWNAADLPWHMERAEKIIERVKAAGVENIVVTFKRSLGNDLKKTYEVLPTCGENVQPSSFCYELYIKKVVVDLGLDVDVWGPANEPNAGESWLPEKSGAKKLAEYNDSLREVVEYWDPTAKRTSPDFSDGKGVKSLEDYLGYYKEAEGGWGDVIAFHPYSGAAAHSLTSVEALKDETPAGKNIWLTELGSFGRSQTLNRSLVEQNDQTRWMVNTLAKVDRVTRIYYYHMRGKPLALPWDTGLTEMDAGNTRRPAWYTWCAASHGDNPLATDCKSSAERFGVFRPSEANFFLTTNVLPVPPATSIFNYGLSTDIPVSGDWDGDGKDSVGVFRTTNANWYLTNATGYPLATNYAFNYGLPGDLPVAGDWDGDGKDSIGVFRPGSANWYLSNSVTTPALSYIFNYGLNGDKPVAGDWDGNGKDGIGVFRNSSANWYLSNTLTGPGIHYSFNYGLSNDRPVAGDWDGDGKDSIGIFRTGSGLWNLSQQINALAVNLGFTYGNANDWPIAGDWDGP